MSAKLDRRSVAKTVAAAGGLLALGGLASAQDPGDNAPLAGEWFNGGKLNQPCAIFQHGSVLLLVNEKGDIASGQMTDANQFAVLKGWEGGLVGRVVERGKVIIWKGGGNWKRR
jgi:hypothetical protein